MKTLTVHDQSYEFYPWQTLGEDIFVLAKKVIESGQKFDRIIALAKGGLTFSRSLVDYLGVEQISSIQIEFYTGIGTTAKTPVITQSLPVSIKGERILLFDDIVDKGDTMRLATEYLKYHGAEDITTCALIEKPWTSIRPDFSARSTEAWVIFPNEARETIELLTEMWSEKGDTRETVLMNLEKMGFLKDEIQLFSK